MSTRSLFAALSASPLLSRGVSAARRTHIPVRGAPSTRCSAPTPKGVACVPPFWILVSSPRDLSETRRRRGENAAGTSILPDPAPRWLPPSESPRGARSNPPLLFDNTAKYGAQDEAKLRSTTLNLWLSFRLNWLIYATQRVGWSRCHHPLCSRKMPLHGR